MFHAKEISKQTLFRINDATRTQTKHNRDPSKTPNGALTSEPRGRDPHQISRARRVSSGHAAVAQPTDILKELPPHPKRGATSELFTHAQTFTVLDLITHHTRADATRTFAIGCAP